MSSLQPPSDNGYNSSKPGDNVANSLEITIRFSASLPDLPLSVPLVASNATTSTLKRMIRASIPLEYQNRRIRLIHAGKALLDDALLSTSLKIPSRPPSRVATPGPQDYNSDGESVNKSRDLKGKTPLREFLVPQQPRIYIHCSIGDVVLTPAELAAEAALANRPLVSDNDSQHAGSSGSDGGRPNETEANTTTTTPPPRGFDRLLTAGFSAAEVQNLRLQFLAIQSHTHTPDTMPSPNTLRDMEDRWLDNSNAVDGGTGTAGGVGSAGMNADDDAQAGALDDMIWGATMGFFWPVGCLMWGTREEGIWTQRRKMAVVVGVIMNIGLGFVRYTS